MYILQACVGVIDDQGDFFHENKRKIGRVLKAASIRCACAPTKFENVYRQTHRQTHTQTTARLVYYRLTVEPSVQVI